MKKHDRPSHAAVTILVVGMTAAACRQELSQVDHGEGEGNPMQGPRLDPGPLPGNSGSDASPVLAPDDPTCARERVSVEPVHIDLQLAVDVSSSMNDRLTGPGAGEAYKWGAVREALVAFLKDPQSAGLGVGLQYFPPETGGDGCQPTRICAPPSGPGDRATTCGIDSDCPIGEGCVTGGLCKGDGKRFCTNLGHPCDGAGGTCVAFGYTCARGNNPPPSSCNLADYSTPAVGMSDLPAGTGPLLTSLLVRIPDGGTPMGKAVEGALLYLRSAPVSSRGRRPVLVIVSDGRPSECVPGEIGAISDLLAEARRQEPAIVTYVIGVVARLEEQEALDQLAAGGGTTKALIASPGEDLSRKFLEALEEVRSAALPCEYVIPSAGRDAVDFGRVNVTFTPSQGQVAVIGKVAGPQACHPTLGGWYYDTDPAAGGTPDRILTCTITCEGLKRDRGGRVDVVFGCKTKVIE